MLGRVQPLKKKKEKKPEMKGATHHKSPAFMRPHLNSLNIRNKRLFSQADVVKKHKASLHEESENSIGKRG